MSNCEHDVLGCFYTAGWSDTVFAICSAGTSKGWRVEEALELPMPANLRGMPQSATKNPQEN
jgi:hypothetical protein